MKTLLLFVILITTSICDDIYPNDFHKISDTYNMNSEYEPKEILLSKIEEIVEYKIIG